MTKHIKIKVLTRLQKPFEDHALKHIDWNNYFVDNEIELIDGRVYNVQWINKHDASLDEMFNNPLEQLDKISKQINSEYNVPTTKLGIR